VHQRSAALAAWQAAGIYNKPDLRLQRFFAAFDKSTSECWPALVALARARYGNYKATLASPLWNSGDKLLRLNLIRAADLNQPDELRLLLQFTATCKPATDAPEIRALIETGNAAILAAVANLQALPQNVFLAVNQSLARIQPAATPAPAKVQGRVGPKRVKAHGPRAGSGRSQAPN
jgi:hypothetical protein